MNIQNSRKNLTLLTFGCPAYETFVPKERIHIP